MTAKAISWTGCMSVLAVAISIAVADEGALPNTQLPNTQLLEDLPADPAAAMVAGIDRFLLREIEQAGRDRTQHWQPGVSIVENRTFLEQRLGLDTRVSPAKAIQYELPPLSDGAECQVYAIRWPVLAHPAPQLKESVTLWGAGLLVRPRQPLGRLLILVPDADETPEQCLGWLPTAASPAEPHASQIPSLIAQFVRAGFTVIVPQTISREIHVQGGARMTRREFVQRSSFELGRTLTGYEVQMVSAVIDQASAGSGLFAARPQDPAPPQVVVCGLGEGGRTALFAGGLDERVDLSICCGFFGPRASIWREPISRNVFGLLERFSDAELGTLIAPRGLVIHPAPTYSVDLPAGGSGAPAQWQSPDMAEVRTEYARLQTMWPQASPSGLTLIEPSGTSASFAQSICLEAANQLAIPELRESESPPLSISQTTALPDAEETAAARGRMLLASWDAHNQALLVESEYERAKFLNLGLPRDDLEDRSNWVDTSSVENYKQSIERFRDVFRHEIVGAFDRPLLPPMPKTKASLQGEHWTGYDVVLDVFPDVFAYGVLLVPNDLRPNEKRPVVVCQHGLEGRPQDTITGDHYAYHDFSASLAEQGFVVFAPQNPYIGKDDFRTLQRKANSIGKTLFSIITPQHQQIVNWLGDLPFVDSERIAFYGLSYGGKSAMRLPALIPEYCLSICSADFNDWVWKNASSRSPYSYLGTGEYEIFEFGLGPKFNYAEMAALIAPRPFMVERGHLDGVAPDDRVAKEFAKVRFLYQARLEFDDRCEIEWFNGPHTIHGKGTFEFLRRHLNWPGTGPQ